METKIVKSSIVSCEEDKHEWIDPNSNLLECKKCGCNSLSEAAKKALEKVTK